MARGERVPISEAHRALGAVLRSARLAVGATTRDIAYFSSGHISNVENGHAMPSEELVYYYVENLGCDESHVRQALEAARRAGRELRRTRRQEHRDRPITPESEAAEIRAAYRTKVVDAAYVLDASGAIDHVSVMRRITPKRPDVRYVTARYGYLSDKRRGVLRLVPGGDCRIAVLRENNWGYLSAVFELTGPPDADGTIRYTYRVLVDSRAPARPAVRYHARGRVDRFSTRVQFTDGRGPKAVWWFRGDDPFGVEKQRRPDRLLPDNPYGLYQCDFNGDGGEYMGISWSWENKRT